jgi:hypothetical protein
VEHLQITCVTPDGVPEGGRPDQDLRPGRVARRVCNRADDVQQILRSGLRLRDPRCPFVHRRWGVVQHGRHRVQGLPHLRCRDHFGACAERGFLDRIEHRLERIANPIQDPGAQQRFPREPAASLRQGEEMPREIPTVDGRDVERVERAEVPRVVPVEEVIVEPAHGGHRLQGRLEPLHHVRDPDPAEVVGDHRAQEIQPHVGR